MKPSLKTTLSLFCIGAFMALLYKGRFDLPMPQKLPHKPTTPEFYEEIVIGPGATNRLAKHGKHDGNTNILVIKFQDGFFYQGSTNGLR